MGKLMAYGDEVTEMNNLAANIDYEVDPAYSTMQEEINDLDDAVTEINSNLKWKTLTTLNGSSTYNFGDLEYNEVMVRANYYNSNENVNFSYNFNLVPQEINNTTARYYNGYGYGYDKPLICLVFVETNSNNTIKLGSFYLNNTDKTSESTLTIYYR